MPDGVEELVAKHRPFYEVAPFYVFMAGEPGNPGRVSRKVRLGVDVNVYGVNPDRRVPAADYSAAYGHVLKLASEVQRLSCLVEVVPFAFSAYLDMTDKRGSQSMVKIRITSRTAAPANGDEEIVLRDLQSRLQALGVKQGRGASK